VKFVQDKRLIQRYFDEVSRDTGKYCFGTDDSLKALELGAVETLIVWDNLEVIRYMLRSSAGGASLNNTVLITLNHAMPIDEIVVHSTQDRVQGQGSFIDKRTGLRMEQVEEPQLLLEWFAEGCHTFGATLELVTNRSQEGVQFCKGFGGIGGLLRYKVDFSTTDEDEFYSDDEDF
jgi:peptide chain release factor subunit 1